MEAIPSARSSPQIRTSAPAIAGSPAAAGDDVGAGVGGAVGAGVSVGVGLRVGEGVGIGLGDDVGVAVGAGDAEGWARVRDAAGEPQADALHHRAAAERLADVVDDQALGGDRAPGLDPLLGGHLAASCCGFCFLDG